MKNVSGGSADLKVSGLKATAPRLKILEIFQRRSTAPEAARHMSAEDVYRVLTQFEQAGLLVRRHFEAGRAVFELNEGPHHDHLVCLSCGRVEEFVDPEIEARQKAIAAERGFELQDHALALYGVCRKPNCGHNGGGNA